MSSLLKWNATPPSRCHSLPHEKWTSLLEREQFKRRVSSSSKHQFCRENVSFQVGIPSRATQKTHLATQSGGSWFLFPRLMNHHTPILNLNHLCDLSFHVWPKKDGKKQKRKNTKQQSGGGKKTQLLSRKSEERAWCVHATSGVSWTHYKLIPYSP